MRTIDLSPLYRSLVGFDRLADQLDAAARNEAASGYPPYNIERTGENEYRIEIAVAGFKPEDMQVVIAKSVATPVIGATLTMSDGDFQIDSIMSETGVWVCKVARHG